MTLRRALLACGVLSSLVYVAANVAGAAVWREYSSFSQTISELSAIGAPSRPVWLPFGIAYDALLLAFAAGVWMCGEGRRPLRASAAMLMAIGVTGTFWPPMHLRGTVVTLTDTMHIVFAGVTSLLILLAIALSAWAFGTRFRVYSIATILVMLVFGALTSMDASRVAADLPTPWLGVFERVNLGAYLLWVSVLARRLLRSPA